MSTGKLSPEEQKISDDVDAAFEQHQRIMAARASGLGLSREEMAEISEAALKQARHPYAIEAKLEGGPIDGQRITVAQNTRWIQVDTHTGETVHQGSGKPIVRPEGVYKETDRRTADGTKIFSHIDRPRPLVFGGQILELYTRENEPRRFRVGEKTRKPMEGTVERIEAVRPIGGIERPAEFIVHFENSDKRRRIPYHGVLDWLETT